MSNIIKLSTPNIQMESDLSRLGTLYLNGSKNRKVFTLENYGTSSVPVELMLSQGGSGNAFVSTHQEALVVQDLLAQ